MTLRELAARWDAFWFAPASPLPVAVYRILLGALVLISGLLMAPDWLQWFGPRGVLSPAAGQALLGPGPRLNVFAWLPHTDAGVLGFLGLHLAAALGLMLGCFTRTSALLVFVTLTSMHHQNNLIFNGGDSLLRLMAFWMIFSRAGDALSVDRRLRRQKGPPQPAAPWALRLMQLQVAAVYLHAVVCKIEGSQWLDGTAVWYAASLVEYRRFPTPLLFDHLVTIKLITWGTLVLEFALGVLIWFRDLRYWLIAAGVSLHLGMEYSLNLPLFEWIMIASFVVFIDGRDLARARDRLAARSQPPEAA